MSQDLINRTCESLSLPLYALIHDSVIHALKASRVSRQVALAVLREIPKLPLSRKEQEELKSAKGGIELEDSFGSGNFFVVDAGSQEAFVCADKKHANYLDHLLESRSDQDFLPDDAAQGGDRKAGGGQAAAFRRQQGQGQGQAQGQQVTTEDLLAKLQMVELMLQGTQPKNKRRNIRIGQRNQQTGKNLLQQIALLEVLRGTDPSELLNRLQMLQLAEQLTASDKDRQGGRTGQQAQQQQDQKQHGEDQQQDAQTQSQGASQQQGNDLLETLRELQLVKALQQL
ncbi:hypothetical protein [Effusibacillus pohliae]|uniref:hypothetical protein n=1 Tax=Effusibacillus pohliae TaxID=232270 RepID=UPI00037A3490|nr:hypothetical protein [Effusibacillus pohliae]